MGKRLKFENFLTNAFYMAVFTPLIVVIEWVMTIVWSIYAYFILTGTLDVDYVSSLVSYFMLYFDKTQVGSLFVAAAFSHLCGILFPKLWIRIPPLLVDIAILLIFAGSLFVHHPIALGSTTAFALVVLIVFSIFKAMNVKYTIYQLKK